MVIRALAIVATLLVAFAVDAPTEARADRMATLQRAGVGTLSTPTLCRGGSDRCLDRRGGRFPQSAYVDRRVCRECAGVGACVG